MKRLIFTLLFTLFVSISAFSKTKIEGIAEKGGKSVKTSSITTYKLVESYPLCTITIYKTGTTNLATIYSDNSGTIKANPFTANSDANYNFYVDNGRYDIKFSGTGISSPFTKSDIIAFDSSATFIDVTNYGVKANGNDDTVALQSAFDNYISGVPIIYPTSLTGTSLISSTLKINNTKNFIFICGISAASPDPYVGQKCKLNWTGAANKKFIEHINSSATLIRGFEFNFSNGSQTNGAAWGIFSTNDADVILTSLSTTSGISTVTLGSMNRGSMVGILPNGDNYQVGRTVLLNGAGISGANLTTTITSVADSTHFTVANPPSTTIAGTGTGIIYSPYLQTNYFTSPKIEDCAFNWGSVTTLISYRAALMIDLYDGYNGERIQLKNITINGNGYSGATNSSLTGMAIYTGHGQSSGNFNGPISPISSNYNGGSNLLQCSAENIFIYGVSFGFHNWCGTAKHIQGSYINVGFFGKWPTIIEDSRFEGNKQFANGYGDTIFLANQWASAVNGTSLIEINITNSSISLWQNKRNFGGAYDGTGTKTVNNNSGALSSVYAFANDSVDSNTSARAGTDYTGSFYGIVNNGGDYTFLGAYPIQIPQWNSSFGALPTRPNGSILFCNDCIKGGNPCAFSGTGSLATRINGVWRCD